jgi:hypothetical protein
MKVGFKTNEEEVYARLGAAVKNSLNGMKEDVDKETIRLQRYIVREKLQGQVLRHVSGTLSDSIRAIPAVVSGYIVTGTVEGAGGLAFYGRSFEEGGSRSYEILPRQKKALAFFGGEGPVPRSASIMADVTRKMSRGTGSVRAKAISQFQDMGGTVVRKVNHPPTPKLPFMQPSLDENRDGIETRLKASIVRSYRQALKSF